MNQETVSQWLLHLDSHTIYDADYVASSFKKATGLEPCWHSTSAKDMVRTIKARGLGGSLKGTKPVVSGYEIASALAKKFSDFYSDKTGRGGIFYDCLAAIKKAGK